MGGIISAPFRMIERTVQHIVHNPINVIPIAAGIATGNPLLAAAAAGATETVRGGNAAQILESAVTTGLGSYAGGSLGGMAGKVLGGTSAAGQILSSMTGQSIGSGLGMAYVQSIQRQQALRKQQAAEESLTIKPPSFEQMRFNAINATRMAFAKEFYDRIPSRYLQITRGSHNRPRYGRRLWKDLVKPRKKLNKHG